MQTSLHRWSKARGVLRPFFLATAGILATGPQRLQNFSAFTVITGQLWLSSARPLLPEGQRERKRRPADAERPGCAGCLAQSDGLDRDERPHVGHPFQLHGQFQLQLQLQIQLQDFPRTAMFFYRFGCFISLVTNVTKKSSKSFWDRKLHANQFAQVGLGQKGFEAVFFCLQLEFQLQALSASGGAALHRTSRHFTATLELLSVHCASLELLGASLELLSAGQLCSPCIDFSYTGNFSYSFSYNFSYKIFSEQLCFSIDLAVSSLL